MVIVDRGWHSTSTRGRRTKWPEFGDVTATGHNDQSNSCISLDQLNLSSCRPIHNSLVTDLQLMWPETSPVIRSRRHMLNQGSGAIQGAYDLEH
jgi:hypothetical protein